MAKKAAASSSEAETTTEVVALPNMMPATLVMPNLDAIGQLENAETGMSLTVKYKLQEDWVKGEAIRCFYLGVKQIPDDKGKLVLSAGFQSKTETFIAAQMVLVDAVRSLPVGTALEIIYQGKKKNSTSEGSTNLFSVNLLNLKA